MARILLPTKFTSQPKTNTALSRGVPRPDAVFLPSLGLRNVGGSLNDNWTATSGMIRKATWNGVGYVTSGASDGVFINSDATNNGHKFSILISLLPGSTTDSKGIFQWAGATATAGGPYILIRTSPSEVISVYYGGGYRISTGIGTYKSDKLLTLVLRSDGSRLRLYEGGELLNTYIGTGGATTRTHAWIGNGYAGSLVDSTYFIGSIWNGVDIGDSSAIKLSTNPWALFQAPPRRLWEDTITIGGTTYTITPSGLLNLSGSSSFIKTRVFLPSGNISFSGASNLTKTKIMSPSGEVALSGNVNLIKGRVISPSGGLSFSGNTLSTKTKVIEPTGSLELSGAASLSGAMSYLISPVGSVVFSGSSQLIKTHIQIPTGGIVFSGTAPIESNTVIQAVSTRIPLTGAGN